ncbi:unnamed protein product [Anisakis simplex]|uniref:Tetratricopeptide repeat protein 21 homolog (inferred by orthology to a C. elegans protein) n=1 Tax=Anisakis simplex TaxID=6269 RepID=A0A0M3JWI9_ANISI|nr:unnamed protein product [Anisakis simplex]
MSSKSEWDVQCNVIYHIREGLFGSASVICDEFLRRNPNNSVVNWLNAIALIKIGKIAEAMRTLEELRRDSTVGFASLIGLRTAHSMAKRPDKESMKEIDKEVNSLWSNSNADQCTKAATVIMLFDNIDKASSLIENAFNKASDNVELTTLKGWLELEKGRDAKLAQKLFEGAIAQVGNIEYCRCLMMSHDWEKTIEQCQRTLLIQNDSVPIHLIQTVYALAIQGDLHSIDGYLSDLNDAIQSNESSNHQCLFKISQLLSGLAEDGSSCAQFARNLLEKAISIEDRAEYLDEHVKALIQSGDLRTAHAIALNALKADDTSDISILLGSQLHFFFSCLYNSFSARNVGVVRCFLAEGQIADAISQMEFVLGTQPNAAQSEVRINRAGYLLAKAKYLSMDLCGAEKLLKSCLDRDETTAEAHLLMAQMQLQKKNYDEAGKCLDVGLSFNFKVREHPIYHLIKAKVQKNCAQIDASISTLRNALQLPSFNSAPSQKREKLDITDGDRIAIYLELMDSLQKMGHIVSSRLLSNSKLALKEEADGVMREALERWSGKAEEQQLILMNANLRLQKGDVDGALTILASIQPNQPNYQTAKIRMAQIYLDEKKDKRQFAICYKQLIQHDPTPLAYVLLGDAYMSIQEILTTRKAFLKPSRAIEVYEAALKNNPKDDALAEKIGQAYVQCHLYSKHKSATSKAVNYYEAALKSGQKSVMRMRLAELLFQLGNYEKCEKVLTQALDAESCPIESSKMSEHVSYWMLLSKLHFENGNWQQASDELSKARDIQKRLINKSPSEVNNILEQRKLAARICCQLAELHWNRREANKAVEYYKEAISLNETDIKTMTALASLYLAIGKLEACNTQCQLILSIDRHNDEATLMMADLLYQSNEADKATVHFTQLLDRNPNQYHALARCIELSWRSGDVEQAEKYLKNAVEANPRATVDAGFNYCKGLHE